MPTKLISRQDRILQFEKCWNNYTELQPTELLSRASDWTQSWGSGLRWASERTFRNFQLCSLNTLFLSFTEGVNETGLAKGVFPVSWERLRRKVKWGGTTITKSLEVWGGEILSNCACSKGSYHFRCPSLLNTITFHFCLSLLKRCFSLTSVTCKRLCLTNPSQN